MGERKRPEDDGFKWPSEENRINSVEGGSKSEAPLRKSKEGDRTGNSASFRNPERNIQNREEKDTALGVMCLVFGIIGLLSTCVLIGIGFDLAAFIMALVVIKRRYYGRGYAIAGLVLSIISFLTALIGTVLLILNIGSIVTSVSDRAVEFFVDNIGGSVIESLFGSAGNDTSEDDTYYDEDYGDEEYYDDSGMQEDGNQQEEEFERLDSYLRERFGDDYAQYVELFGEYLQRE